MMKETDFDYIIAGAGAAGLSLLARMIHSGNFSEKKILLVDKEPKIHNDRTWCFWEIGDGFFEEIIYKSWKIIGIHGDKFSKEINIQPYQYKMIRGIDFYEYCLNLIKRTSSIEIKYGTISKIKTCGNRASVIIDNEELTAKLIFNSIRFNSAPQKAARYDLLQHFMGWTIHAEQEIFDPEIATLMDFRTVQHGPCSFVYTMPFSSHNALVEYTVFSDKLLGEKEYADALAQYIASRYPDLKYNITSTEFGVIPMTDLDFPSKDDSIIYIGTAGGQTKPSTGYTFQFIQKQTNHIVDLLSKRKSLNLLPRVPGKYRFYDRVLLNVLATRKLVGSEIFIPLFEKNPSSRIFRFLDNESSLIDDVSLISSLPTMPFLRASFE